MKEPIEELFKQSLKGHEMPYNPDAWKAMSARLDVVSPVAGPTSYLNYYLGAAGIGVAAVATYFFFAGGNVPDSNSSAIAKETQTEQTNAASGANAKNEKKTTTATSNGEAQTGNTTVIPAPTETPTSPEKGLQTSSTKGNSDIDPKTNKVHSNKSGETPGTDKGQNSGLANDPTPSETGKKPKNTDLNTIANQKMTMPAIDDLCLNEEITITNPNGKEIYLLDALNNTVKVIPAKKSVVFKPTVVGNYSLGYKNDTKIQSSSNFRVNRIPDAEFTIDLVNKFENGIPSTHVEAIGGQGTYIWNAENQSAIGIEADMHFYKKGEQTIELTVNNGQCASTIEKTIFIENDYNLMAVNSFTPTSPRHENTTFIPFALTQRDVRFRFMIIDGRDGGIVYETSDASMPWDGTDIRSGRRSETPQVYVWKAVILNPGANEPSEYRGTITMN